MRSANKFLLLIVPATLLALGVVFAFLSAQRALTRARAMAASGHGVPFSLRPLEGLLAAPPNVGFEPVESAFEATCAAFLDGTLYAAGPGGLARVGADGVTRPILRTGMELPTGQITGMSAGRMRGASDAGLLLATSGAGLLLVSPPGQGAVSVRQLLPAGAALRDVSAVLALPTGDVLLGTRNDGVLVFNGTTLFPLRFSLSGLDTSHLEVTSLAAPVNDPAMVLLGTRNAGVVLLRGGLAERADTGSGMPDHQVESIVVRDRVAFVGTPLGVAQFNLLAPDFRPMRTLAPGTFAHALAVDAAGLAIGTLQEGVLQVPVSEAAHLGRASLASPRGPLADTFAENHGRIDALLPVPGGGMLALADGRVMRRGSAGWEDAADAVNRGGLTDRNISALAFGPDGRLYVGFFNRGLDIVDPDSSSSPVHLEDDHLFCINRLVRDPVRQTIAAATADGLVLFDAAGKPRQVLMRRDGLISDHVSDVAFTSTGPVLATPAGLTFLTASGPQSLYAFQGLVNNHVYTLASNAFGTELLAGTLGGLSVLESGEVRRSLTTSNSGLQHNWITALAPMPTGGFLVGTYGAGLARLSPQGVVTAVDLPAGVPRDVVVNPNALLVTPTHVVAGTLAHGMLVYTLATGSWTAVRSGLPSPNVTAFAERNGELYVGTENGLVRIAEARLP